MKDMCETLQLHFPQAQMRIERHTHKSNNNSGLWFSFQLNPHTVEDQDFLVGSNPKLSGLLHEIWSEH